MDEQTIRAKVEQEIREKALRYIRHSIELAHGHRCRIEYPLTNPLTNEVETGPHLTGAKARILYLTAASADIAFATAMGWIPEDEQFDWIQKLHKPPEAPATPDNKP